MGLVGWVLFTLVYSIWLWARDLWPGIHQAPAPILTDVQLVTELARKVVSVQFVDSLGNVVAGPVNTILVTCTFNVGEANGDLREWGLFGGNATAIVNSGIMVDHVNTTKLTKPSGVSDFSLTRLVTLIF